VDSQSLCNTYSKFPSNDEVRVSVRIYLFERNPLASLFARRELEYLNSSGDELNFISNEKVRTRIVLGERT